MEVYSAPPTTLNRHADEVPARSFMASYTSDHEGIRQFSREDALRRPFLISGYDVEAYSAPLSTLDTRADQMPAHCFALRSPGLFFLAQRFR
ncbi:hypothetical protein Hypma_003355 [Hypsizygus marmoreus]|uniref:Uncharacterized protein n=1 Tax=Hypsizygus marmoreus TaxID=39966 RepID=A0A369J2C8_HYPMA|nr:hypothetical protein Hypma_003355 [Hypsizygus marmoreus]